MLEDCYKGYYLLCFKLLEVITTILQKHNTIDTHTQTHIHIHAHTNTHTHTQFMLWVGDQIEFGSQIGTIFGPKYVSVLYNIMIICAKFILFHKV